MKTILYLEVAYSPFIIIVGFSGEKLYSEEFKMGSEFAPIKNFLIGVIDELFPKMSEDILVVTETIFRKLTQHVSNRYPSNIFCVDSITINDVTQYYKVEVKSA